MATKKTVLVFGTFDGLHEGHLFFLRAARTLSSVKKSDGQARRVGSRLIAIVAQDSVVKTLKGKPPREPLAKRLAALRASGLVDEAVAGDVVLGNWSALQKYKPETIALGYDQTELEKELGEYMKKKILPTTLIRIAPHKPDIYHSSLIQ